MMVGVDLCDDVTQISCMESQDAQPHPIGRRMGRELDREYEIPTALGYTPARRSWSYGTEAVGLAAQGGTDLLDHLVSRVSSREVIQKEGYKVDPVEALVRFLAKALSALHEFYPNRSIRKIVVTVEQRNDPLDAAITKAMAALGIESDRLVIQPHKLSYMYYALSQPPELWQRNVGLFEYSGSSMFYSQIDIDRRTSPYIVGVRRKDLSQMMDFSLLEQDEISPEYAFLNLANTQLHKQMVTTIYVTGSGFQEVWAGKALKQLCNGRRVFRGQNLFTKGACFAAREMCGAGTLSQFLFLDEEMIYCNISLKVYTDAKEQELTLARAGMGWRDVDVSLDIIPDHEEELALQVHNVLRHEKKTHLLSLSDFADRENRMTRFTVRIRFADASNCIITLKDNGFGEFCPSSNRIWETKITI